MARRAATIVVGALLLAACGSEENVREFPPAAEPARSPAPEQRPAGTVVEIGNKPEGVVADGRTDRIAVALTDPDELAIARLDGEVVERIPLPGAPRHLRLAEGRVLVPAESGDRLVEVSLPGGDARTTPVGDGPHDADAADGRVFVADEFGSTMSIVEDGRRVEQVPAPRQPGGIAAVPGGPIALVAVRERVLALFDPSTGEKIAQQPAGVGPTHVEAGAEGRVYVADTAGDAILLFQTRPELELVRRVALPGAPYGMTMDRERGRLWVTLTETNEVVWLPAHGRPRPIDRHPTVRQPNSVAVHEPSGRVYVASRYAGTLQIIEP